MTDIQFGRLIDLPLRDAWKHEALQFTPWLAQNIDHLSEVIGIPLELDGTEVAVDTFSADILARNPMDDSVVLIENQLEQTDHTHLGQIMTYLAGLDAQTVVWIAPHFREPHLSAIRWLNQHTADGFGFFAVKARVVRIGDSPFAPIFEVVEKPNGWDRSLRPQKDVVEGQASLRRVNFWTMYLERYPEAADAGVRVNKEFAKWLTSPAPNTIIGLYIAQKSCGIYLRGREQSDFDEVLAEFLPHKDVLEQRLGAPLTSSSAKSDWLLVSSIDRPISDEAHWPEIIDWMEERRKLYLATLTDIFGPIDQ